MQHITETITATERPEAVCAVADFKSAMELICKVVSRRETIPILANVRIAATSSGLVLTGTDMDLETNILVPATCDSRLRFTIPAFGLLDWLKSIDASGPVKITAPTFEAETYTDHNGDETERMVNTIPARLTSGNSEMEFQALPFSDFPSVSRLENPASFRIGRAALHHALDGVAFAISTEETRYYLNGAFLHIGDDFARIVATDGHRLALQELERPAIDGELWSHSHYASGHGAIIPREAVALLNFALKETRKAPRPEVSDGIKVCLTESRIEFYSKRLHIRSKLIDGSFPDYDRVIPQHNSKTAIFQSEAMKKSVDTVAKISSQRGRAVKVELDDSGLAKLTVNNPDSGSAKGTCPVAFIGEEMEVGFNHSYLSEMLKTVGKGEVVMELQEPGCPCVITGTREGWKGVLMPMRV